MTVRLYDSKAQALRDFVPLVEGHVGMYVCGPTVQSSPHIGHLRSALVYDQMRRWFTARGYRVTFVRNVMFISMAIGLVFYYAFPAAPPRLMALHGYDLGFTDTVFGGDTSVQYAQPSLILNEYAAIPSFHFGWIALASAAIWVNTRSVTWRVLAVSLTVVMTWAIVASANHLFIDMALGGLIVGISWAIARRLQRRNAAREASVPAAP